MSQLLELRPQDKIIHNIDFQAYRYKQERQAVQFMPDPGEAQTITILTPWGGELVAEKGDYIVNEIDSPDNKWPVQQDIFEATYAELRPGIYIKRAIVHLFPLANITKDPEQLVRVHTNEGVVTVRSGDFFLAKGVKGEIWPMPNDKVDSALDRVEN